MSFQLIPGQQHAKRILQNGLRHGTLSHAYIFSGPKGSGRKQTAMTLAQAVYCQNCEDDACGECIECRKILHGNHPDIHWIEPDGTAIKIEQIRELQKEFAYRSAGAQKKIYIINEAERMTVQAANSLLKFLEEPGSDVMAILITENGQALLPTIQSRAQMIPFTAMDIGSMTRLLEEEGFPSSLLRPAVRLTAGIDAARELVEAKWFAEGRSVMIQLAKETLTRFPAAMLTAQQKVIKSELADHLPVLLDLWMLWFKDMVQLQCGRREQIVYIDQIDWMSTQALSREQRFWVNGMEKIVEIQKRLRFHANPQLALEKLMIDIQGG